MSMFGLVVVLALLGVLGVSSETSGATAPDYELSIDHATVARPGLSVPFSVTIKKNGGFQGPVDVSISSSYLDLFDENGLSPAPETASADDEKVFLRFAPPPGDTLSISFDVRIDPSVQQGASGEVAVIDSGLEVVSATMQTTVLP